MTTSIKPHVAKVKFMFTSKELGLSDIYSKMKNWDIKQQWEFLKRNQNTAVYRTAEIEYSNNTEWQTKYHETRENVRKELMIEYLKFLDSIEANSTELSNLVTSSAEPAPAQE